MNVNEWGNYIRINAREDISANTNVMTLKSPQPVVKTQTFTSANGLSVGTVDLDVGGETFKANEYVEYQIQQGDIFLSGDWTARLYSTTPGDAENKISDEPLIFTVDP